MRHTLVGLVLAIAATPALAGHDKTDIVTTHDGSTFVGEIKSVKYATLNLNTGPAGLLAIEWRHVTGLTSKFQYRVELSGGVRHFGSLGPPKEHGHLSIVSDSGTVEVDLADVVEITPIAHGFWKRLDGSVNFGLSYTQANNALQYNLNADATYRSRKNYAQLSGQSIFNTQDGGESTNQHSVKFFVAQVTRYKWGPFELAQLQSNPDQGYDARLIVGGGAANFFIENSRKLFTLTLGAVYNRENVTDSADVDQSAEALAGIAFRRFKRGSHSPSVQLNLQTFTNMTDTPRFRAALLFNVSWKVFGNFQASFLLNDNYDSRPPGTDSVKNDMSVVTSFGYTF